MLHAKQPNWVGTFVGGGIAIEVERAFTAFCGGQQRKRLALGGWKEGRYGVGWNRDRSVA
jgi:hypothetical protein